MMNDKTKLREMKKQRIKEATDGLIAAFRAVNVEVAKAISFDESFDKDELKNRMLNILDVLMQISSLNALEGPAGDSDDVKRTLDALYNLRDLCVASLNAIKADETTGEETLADGFHSLANSFESAKESAEYALNKLTKPEKAR